MKVLRWSLPVDDKLHEFALTGPIVHVASRQPDVVEMWEVTNDLSAPRRVGFQAFGTGQEVPYGARYVGTALAAGGALVWHVFADATSRVGRDVTR